MSKFRGYAQGEGFEPIKAPDTSQRILNRADDTIRGIREVRDADIANTAAYLNSFNEKMEAERESFSNYSKLLQLNDKTKRDAVEIRAQENAERQRELGVNRANIYKAVAGLSTQAAGMISKYREDKYQSDYDEHLYRLYTQGPSEQSDAAGYIADKHTMYNLQMTDISRLGGAAAAEANGSSPIQTAELRSQAHGLNTAELHAQADFMAQRWPLFLQQSFTNDKETQVKLYGPNGTFRTGTPSEAHSSKDKALVAQQLLKKHIQDNGFYGKSPAFLTDALTKMSQGTNQIVASAMTDEVSLQRQQQIDKVETIFRSSDGNAAQRFHFAYNYISNIHPGQQAAARERLFKIMHDQRQVINGVVVGMSDEEVSEIMNSSFSHQPDKTLAQLFQGELIKLTDARRITREQLHTAEVTQRRHAVEKDLINLKDTVKDDLLGDGILDLNDENITEMVKRYQQLGPDYSPQIAFLESLRDKTYQAINAAPVIADIEKRIAQGSISGDEIMEDGRIPKTDKIRLMKEADKSDKTNPSETLMTSAKESISERLRSRARVNGATSIHYSLGVMRRHALNEFRKMYKLAMQDTNDPSIAYNNAISSFNAEYDKEGGKYSLINEKDLVERARAGKPFDSGIFKFYSNHEAKAVTPETTHLEIQTLLSSNPAAINTPIITEPVLKKVITQYSNGQKHSLIPQLQIIQKTVTKPNGDRYSYAELLEKQFNAYEGLDIPEGLGTALQFENSIPSRYKKFGIYPSATNSDIMIMASGSPSVYSRNFEISNDQVSALNVLAKYESSAYIQNNDGGYNAMNQGGTKEGREAINPGHSTAILGKLLTSMTIGEVIQAQKNGRLHAAGRYQFTNNTGTLDDTIKLAGGISLNSKFDAKTQDFLALTLMRSRGITPWIGPVDRASPAERQLIESARSQPISFGPSVWAQGDNMNPELVKRKLAGAK